MAPGSTFFQIDLIMGKTVGAIRVDDSHFSGDIPQAGDILTSTDGVTFTRVAQWTTANVSSGILTVTFTPVIARVIKLVATQTPAVATNWFSIGELKVYSSYPAPAWTLSASDNQGAAGDAADGNASSRWTSYGAVNPGVTYFQIDRHYIGQIGALRLDDTQSSDDIPQTGDVYASADGTSYTRVAQWTSSNISAGVLNVSWTPVMTRFVKIVATSTPAVTGNWFSIHEIYLYATSP